MRLPTRFSTRNSGFSALFIVFYTKLTKNIKGFSAIIKAQLQTKVAIMPRFVKASDAFHARLSIDSRLREIQAAAKTLQPPRGGWIRAIRIGLGMSATDLAKRLGVHNSTMTRLESNESEGVLNLSSLHRVADALECDLVYALVPRRPLADTVTEHARSLAELSIQETQNTMALENQGLSTEVLRALIDRQTDELSHSSGLWSETGVR